MDGLGFVFFYIIDIGFKTLRIKQIQITYVLCQFKVDNQHHIHLIQVHTEKQHLLCH